jgi:hypothetical protein
MAAADGRQASLGWMALIDILGEEAANRPTAERSLKRPLASPK